MCNGSYPDAINLFEKENVEWKPSQDTFPYSGRVVNWK